MDALADWDAPQSRAWRCSGCHAQVRLGHTPMTVEIVATGERHVCPTPRPKPMPRWQGEPMTEGDKTLRALRALESTALSFEATVAQLAALTQRRVDTTVGAGPVRTGAPVVPSQQALLSQPPPAQPPEPVADTEPERPQSALLARMGIGEESRE